MWKGPKFQHKTHVSCNYNTHAYFLVLCNSFSVFTFSHTRSGVEFSNGDVTLACASFGAFWISGLGILN